MSERRLARRGQAQSIVLPLKQGDAKLILEILDLAGYGRLGNMQSRRRPTDVRLFGCHHEITKMPEFHRILERYN